MKLKSTHLIYGLLAGITMIVVSYIIYFLGKSFKPGYPYISYIPLLVFLILNAISFSKANNGYVTYGNVYGSCFKLSVIAGFIMMISGVVIIYTLPGMKEEGLEATRQQMLKTPGMTDEALENAMELTRKSWNYVLVIGGLLMPIIFGVILSLLAAAIPERKGEMPIELELSGDE